MSIMTVDLSENEMYIETLQQAAKSIESDGFDGLHSAASLVGMQTALALLIAHLRCGYGSMDGWPTDSGIDVEVLRDLLAKEPSVMGFFLRPCAFFYTGEWHCFDNFSALSVRWDGMRWPTAEHAYQAAKFIDSGARDIIHHTSSPYEAKKLGNDPARLKGRRDDWEFKKHGVMESILRAKLGQHEQVQKKLKESSDRGLILVEDSHRDAHWGRGKNWDGENWLGRIWMKIRDDHYPPS